MENEMTAARFVFFAAGTALRAAVAAAVLFSFAAAGDDVRLTGKKMEIRPKQNTTVFSGGAVVEHSSFTMKADRIVSRDSNREFEAYGSVRVADTDGRREISGDSGVYSSKTRQGSLQGSPVVAVMTDTESVKSVLETPRLDWTHSTALARGNSVLRRPGLELRAPLISYDIEAERLDAEPLERLIVDDKKYRADLRAGKMTYLRAERRIRLEDGVSGTVVLKKKSMQGGKQ